MISIIDYGAGNLHSVQKAFEHLGFDTAIVKKPGEILSATHVVLPGVGAFSDAMSNLRKTKLDMAITQAIKQGKNFLGICLGMQLLFDSGVEGGQRTAGLGVFSGEVAKLPQNVIVPHMGWNNITGSDDIIFNDAQEVYMYFVHSFCCPVSEYTAAVCDYGIPFTAAVRKGNCLGVQFHPEKSGDAGLEILKRFGGLINADQKNHPLS